LVLQHAPSGIFHCVPDGHTSWHGFACAILPQFHPIQPILAAEYSTSIRRPRDSRLDNRKLKTLGIATRHWREGLRECMEAANAAA
jgi:dTDP-4-dehydrorhamnose reductase